jgi:dinuclear metal center YbgI/SA1388 family protein
MKLSQIIDYMDRIAPPKLAQAWDKSGLLFGDVEMNVTGAVLCLDVTEDVFRLCQEKNANLCICHHPFIFEPIERIDFKNPHHTLLIRLIQENIAVFSAHTNLDCCVGGVNDILAQMLDFVDVSPFIYSTESYDSCQKIKYGIGRIGRPKELYQLFEFCKILKKELAPSGIIVNFDRDKVFNKALVVGGSYDTKWNSSVLESGIDLVITGEMKHNDMIFFQRYNIAVILAGHDCTERVILKSLADRLHEQFHEIQFAVSYNLNYNKLGF